MEEVIRQPAGCAVSIRKAYGEALVRTGQSHENVVVLSADVSNSDHSYMFEEKFPERFFNVGIAEQALVDVAVGLAKSGKVPVANTFAALFSLRAVEMVRTHLCYGQANVKLAAAYAGLSDSFDGPTHHSICDLAIMRSLPNMTIVVPADPTAVGKLLPEIVDFEGPVFFRLCRNEVPVIFNEQYEPRIGNGVVLRKGTDITIIACGVMVYRCLQAAEDLAKEGLQAKVVEMHTIKPLDKDLVVCCAEETDAIVTVEEHSIIGGLGGAVAETLATTRPTVLEIVGVDDTFTESGPYEELMDKYGLGLDNIIAAAKRAVERKER